MKRLCIGFLAIGILACPACRQTPPPIGYAESAPIVAKRTELAQHLLQLLPREQQQLPQAQAEARLLADTAYKASAAIGRINNPKRWPAWRNNHLVNSYGPDSLERGLCWHYQHDLFRELRRFPLTYFRIGCCVRNREDTDHEHNCVYITPASAAWPHCIILDAWKKAGRLLTLYPDDFLHDAWPCKRFFSSIPAKIKHALSRASGLSVEVRIHTAGKGFPTLVKKLLSSGSVPLSDTTQKAFI